MAKHATTTYRVIILSSPISSRQTPSVAPDSPFDIADLIEDTLGRSPYFGESKVEQSDYRKDQYNDLVYSAEQGASVSGNTFFKGISQPRH